MATQRFSDGQTRSLSDAETTREVARLPVLADVLPQAARTAAMITTNKHLNANAVPCGSRRGRLGFTSQLVGPGSTAAEADFSRGNDRLLGQRTTADIREKHTSHVTTSITTG